MKRFVVSHIDWFDHELVSMIVLADDWRGAIAQHPKIATYDDWPVESLELAREHAFNCDCMIDCLEIPELMSSAS